MERSYANGTSSVPLLGETIGENLERTVARVPDQVAVISRHQELRLTYRQLDEAVDAVASGLLARGFAVGDLLGIWSPNNVEWILVQYATAKLGVILVNINPAYRSHELEYVLRQSGCRGLVSAPSFKSSDYAAMVDSIRPSVPGLTDVFFLGSEHWEELRATPPAPDALRNRMAQLGCDQPINIQYTSGTTGFPKGATLSHHNILNNGFFVGEVCGYAEQDLVCLPVPFYHCFGMVMGSLGCTSHGSTIVIPSEAFEPEAVLQAVEAERCTSLYGVPTMFIAELAHPDFERYDLSSLRTGIMAGSPCPVEVMKQVVDRMHMAEVTICYGMTETSPVSTQTTMDDDLDLRVSSVGRVHPHVEVKVIDPDTGLTVPRATPGELCTRGYSVMLGYWNDPEQTAAAIDAARWMHTADLATMSGDGYLNIVGRIKDMVIRGGENVFPREIEEFLYTHPDVTDVQVVGVPDERYGEQIMAWVKLADGSSCDEETLREYCRSSIAHYKVPRYFKFVDEFPMTITGKIQKFKMREISVAELGLDDVAARPTA